MNWIRPEHLESIKETKYVSGTVPKLDFAIMDYFDSNDTSWFEYAYAEVVYLEEKNTIKVIAASVTNDETKDQYAFKDLLLKLPVITPVSFNYLCTCYYRRFHESEKLFKAFKGSVPWLNLITIDTYGKIVFDYQAAHLYSFLSGKNETEAYRWVKDMTERYADAYVEGINLQVNKNKNLADVWEEYTLNGLVLHPKRKGADILWNHLQQYLFK